MLPVTAAYGVLGIITTRMDGTFKYSHLLLAFVICHLERLPAIGAIYAKVVLAPDTILLPFGLGEPRRLVRHGGSASASSACVLL